MSAASTKVLSTTSVCLIESLLSNSRAASTLVSIDTPLPLIAETIPSSSISGIDDRIACDIESESLEESKSSAVETCSGPSITASLITPTASEARFSETSFLANSQRTGLGKLSPISDRIVKPLNNSSADKSSPQCSDFFQATIRIALDRPSSPSHRAQSLHSVISPERILISRACCFATSPNCSSAIPSNTCNA